MVVLGLTSCQKASDGTDPYATMPDPQEIIDAAVFTDLEGNTVTLDAFEGQFIVVDFWESWCGPCLQVFPAMQQLTEEYPGQFTMLAVTVGMTEGPIEAKEFREQHPYTFTYLYDKNDVFEQFQIGSIPFKVLIGPDGKVIKAELGSRGKEGDYNHVKSLFLNAIQAVDPA